MNKSTDIYIVKNPNSKTNKGGYKIDHKRDYPCHCKNCDKDFRGFSSNKAFCSEECEYEFRSKEHINQGKCLTCQKELTLKQLKRSSKFCNISCSTIFNNAQRTDEENARIAEICRESQKQIMSDPEEIERRTKKRLEAISNWSEERKLQHKETLYRNAKKQFEDPEQRKAISIRNKEYWKNITEDQLKERSKKNRETRSKWTEEKRNEYRKNMKERRRKTTLKGLLNVENLNKEFCLEKFVKKDRFLFEEFKEYFGLAKSLAYTIKSELGIEIQNKVTMSRPQEQLFNWVPVSIENKKANDRSFIKPLELDILIHSHKLAIEYNGLYHHSSIGDNSKDKNYHLQKTELVEEKGYQLFQIFSSDDLDIWKSIINNKLGLNTKIFARKCIIKEVKAEEARKFLEENHLQGYCQSKYKIGLYLDDELVSLMTFGKPRYNKNYDWELLRFCSKKGYNVIAGASKLLSYFRREHSGSIISYTNRRWSNGHLYETLGFEFLHNTDPSYFYFKNDYEIYSRFEFQKHKLKDKLVNFDPNLTEEENLLNNRYGKIYDCGNKVYILK